MEIIYVLALTVSNIICVIIGAKLGQKVVKGEDIELPTLNPMKAIREHQDRKEAEREADKFNTLMHNIDAYDGTSNGQKDV
ncbi:MAG: hypothetical protein IKU66_05275 [Clostridia bacterium]|nr:hypothetical protein [Clostridia bacterium]